ncbi:MAG: mandelate racemase/muconate lactonizing enzyme family protein [Oscillospiraceae bacterium]|nr:mandelate racemase/muconate lactonizing enzyme family protein [Oscillospiraceae bacterium]
MKITKVYTEKYKWPKAKPIANGKHVFTHNELNLLCIETDAGITGYGCSWEINFCERIGQSLIGEDPMNNERIWQKMYIPKFLGRKGNSLWTISAIDIAIWDIKSKASGIPLYKLLGGAKDSVPYYIAGGYYGPDKGIRELQQEMEEYMSWGAKAVKMKVGAMSMKDDIARVKAVREVIGEDTKLMVDANCAYKFYEAIEFAKRAEQFDLTWFEEPVEQDDYDGYKKIAAKTCIPLAAGENEATRFGYRDLINTQAISIMNPDAETMGGITEFMKIASMADANGLVLSPHGQQQVHVHLNCAVPNAIIAEFYPPQYDAKVYEAFKNPITLNADGTISPSEAPGTGLDINRDVLAAYRIQ